MCALKLPMRDARHHLVEDGLADVRKQRESAFTTVNRPLARQAYLEMQITSRSLLPRQQSSLVAVLGLSLTALTLSGTAPAFTPPKSAFPCQVLLRRRFTFLNAAVTSARAICCLLSVNAHPSRIMFGHHPKNKPQPNYAIDMPPLDQKLWDPFGVKIEGWLKISEGRHLVGFEFRVADRLAGETHVLFPRLDVAEALKGGAYAGFSICVRAPWALGKVNCECQLIALYNESKELVSSFSRNWGSQDYRQVDYGSLLESGNIHLHHRSDIYSSGPSSPIPSPECLQLVKRYLGMPPLKVLDIGCGIGAYGEPLIRDGYDWLGVEIKDTDCVALQEKKLPHLRVDGKRLALEDKSHDMAISIEVLEHIAEPLPFLAEIVRVTKSRIIISVPNIEILPYMRPILAAPWHILEGDHKNFFTRNSLRALLGAAGLSKVEIIPYAVAPLKSVEGLPLYYHLLAIAEV